MAATTDLQWADKNVGRIHSAGAKEVFETSSTLQLAASVLEVAGVTVTSNGTELNLLDGISALATLTVGSMDITVGAEGGDTINVSVQFKDLAGNNMAKRVPFRYYISDDSNGEGETGTAPDTDVSIGTNGTINVEITADVSGFAISNATGAADFDIEDSTDSAAWYMVFIPEGGLVHDVSDAINFA